MFFFHTYKYLKYTLLSHHKRGHGIHSPFVYDLVSRVFRNKTDPEVVFLVEKIRKRLIADRRTIPVHDLGSGSGVSKKTRKVSDIAQRSPVPLKYGKLLSRMSAEFGQPLIVELGTSFGISTTYMAATSRDTPVKTIEGSRAIADIARQNFIDADLQNINIINSSFDDAIPGLALTGIQPGLIFIDGDHRKEPLLRYFSSLAQLSGSKTVIIIDDINYSKEMNDAWEEIKLHERVSVTIDICRMGICFFREGINHNSYVIRY